MKSTIRRKSPYLQKKDDYENDFRVWNSEHARKNHAENKKRLHRTVRRKVRQTLGQISKHYINAYGDTFPSSSFQLYRIKTMRFNPMSLKEIIEKKQNRRAEILILQNFFKEVCEECGCCRRYYYTHYASLCTDRRERFKNFLRSLLQNQHKYSVPIANYFFHALYEVMRPYAYYHQRIKMRLEEFFRLEPSWEIPLRNWISAHIAI